MSVTVGDIMKLPSMRQARVVGGKLGLSKVVYSISVLESVDPKNLVDGVFQKGEFFGSEIVISAFMNCPHDVELQYANIRRLAEGGEVGLIWFYVGIFVPEIDPRIIELADELDFVLIQMPQTLELRYGEVISDVTEAIYHDRIQNESIVSDILANVSKLPEHQRTIATVLQMLSDRIHSSIVLADSSYAILNLVTWPRSIEKDFPLLPADLKKNGGLVNGQVRNLGQDGLLCHSVIHPDGGESMHLFMLKVGTPVSQSVQEQIADTVRICANIWGREHSAVVIRELIRAIIQDDPIKMRRLSEVFHIDVAAVHDMWLLYCDNKKDLECVKEKAEDILDILSDCTSLQFGDVYDDKLLMFSSDPATEKDAENVWNEVSKLLSCIPGISFVWCNGLQTTTDVREAYICCNTFLNDVRKIYPKKRFFRIGDVRFAKSCSEIINAGENSMKPFVKCTELLSKCSEDWDAVDTMACHLLDNDASVTKTSEALFLHKNTVKYRIKVVSDVFGFLPDKLPEGWQLYQSLAIERLLKK